MFDASLSGHSARLPGRLISIAIHTLAVLLFWQPKVIEKKLSGIQVVHASAMETVWLPVENPVTLPRAPAPPQPRVESFNSSAGQVQPEEDHSTPGAETITSDISKLFNVGVVSDLSEQTLESRLKRITRLDMESPELLVGPPPEFENKPADTVAYDSRVGRRLEPARALRRIIPVYPTLAKKARIQGTVVLEATITESGAVENVTVITGHPMLIDAAVDAIRRWRYEPAKLDGIPVRSSVSINVNFKLEFQ